MDSPLAPAAAAAVAGLAAGYLCAAAQTGGGGEAGGGGGGSGTFAGPKKFPMLQFSHMGVFAVRRPQPRFPASAGVADANGFRRAPLLPRAGSVLALNFEHELEHSGFRAQAN
eukprot:SAG22_NODE_958_length_6301_cov_4.995324_1_plen_113_part_00